ncbi:branched-chain amino acid transport system ATP-binding protein [Bosea sp. OK403]|uniref:ABC transporter ATP-binding protein n=1 Tax=Bosea sp. OK403 TaxID=1855286 RepID=UPI0008F0ED6C|nr:ABC transporter ATP-binding protein [Bosea sp. OK403]SFJ92488.1 branched-chain amino acid transport system ATP-binding protein [Bosea sp. OK403]
MASEPFLDVQGLTIRFGGLTAVGGFDMAVAKGSIHALIGPNGAGKSTTFNCISRFYTPSEGRILFDGQDITRLPARAMAGLGVARSFQNLELFSELSVFENVLIGAHVHAGRSWRDAISARPAEIGEHVEHLLERTGLADYAQTKARNLDFGHQKMVEIARALAMRPKLLLLDEPAAGLRNREIAALDRLLCELRERDGLTIVLVEHVMQLVMSISDRITVLSFGTKIAEGTAAEVRAHPAVIEAYLGRETTHA